MAEGVEGLKIPLGVQYTREGAKEVFYDPVKYHSEFIGVTGSGKSTIAYNSFRQIVEAGYGICVLDPKGDLAEECLASVPRNRLEDVIYIAPKLFDKEISLNPLAGDKKPIRLQHLIFIARENWKDSWGAQTDEILNVFGSLAIKAIRKPNFLHIWKATLKESYADELRNYPGVDEATKLSYDKYRNWDQRQRDQAMAPPSNKLGFFLPLMHLLAQPDSFDFRWAMDNSKIVICNLAKGRLTPQHTAMLGSLITNKIYFATMERESTKHRPRFFLMVDEYRDLTAGNPMETLLAQGRGLGLSIIAFDQGKTADLDNFANVFVGNLSSVEDAEYLAKVVGTTPDAIYSTPPYAWWGKEYDVRGIRFDAYPSRPKLKGTAQKAKVIRHSYENYGRRVEDIQRDIDKFLREGGESHASSGKRKGPVLRNGQWRDHSSGGRPSGA